MRGLHRSGADDRWVGGGFFVFDSEIRDERLDERPVGLKFNTTKKCCGP
jgi:hypothetical protein